MILRVSLTAILLLPAAAYAQTTDGFITTKAQIGDPADVEYDGPALIVADRAAHRIRAVAPDGTVTTVAGSGDPASDCQDGGDDLNLPRGVTSGIITSAGVHCLVEPTASGLRRLAGNADGQPGLSGDGGPARSARLRDPADTAIGPDGSIYIADTGNDRIRRVAPDGTISTFAGTTQGFGGDNGPATQAQLDTPRDVAVSSDGSVLIADLGNGRVRRVTPDGIIRTVAGGTGPGIAGDGDPALTAQLTSPVALVPLTNRGFLVADGSTNRVRRVTPLGAILLSAGGGSGGDGGLAKDAALSRPEGLAARPGGGFTVADTGNGRVRDVTDLGAIPPAVLQRSFNVAPGIGDVTVLGLPLEEDDIVPLGSEVDTRKGRVNLTVRRADGSLAPGRAFDGIFRTTQRGDVTELTLTEDLGCGTTRGQKGLSLLSTAAKKKRKKKRRRLWVDAKGRYRIKGRHVGAVERGTRWRVMDECNRSVVTVAEGSVIARDLVRGTRRIVRAGQRFIVRAR